MWVQLPAVHIPTPPLQLPLIGTPGITCGLNVSPSFQNGVTSSSPRGRVLQVRLEQPGDSPAGAPCPHEAQPPFVRLCASVDSALLSPSLRQESPSTTRDRPTASFRIFLQGSRKFPRGPGSAQLAST